MVLAGDVVRLDTQAHKGHYRIDRLKEDGLRLAEATRVDPEVYLPQRLYEEGASLQPFVGPTPVEMLFLDLPLLTGQVTKFRMSRMSPRQRALGLALYSSPQDYDFVLQDVLNKRSIVGQLTTPLLRGPTGVWDRQEGVNVKLVSGSLASVDTASLFSGANTIAVGDGTADNWEINQFA